MKHLMFLALASLFAAPAAGAKTAPASLKWSAAPPSLPAGAQMAVVSGDPTKKGKFVVELKMPANYAVPPHWHPTDETVKVVSGKLHYAMTDKIDMAKATTLTAGHSVTMKARMHHWVHAPAPATIQDGAVPDHICRSEG
jgi:hypothetical protein